MYVEKNTKVFWEIVGYVGLVLCIIGQITVGKWYPFAQFAYLLANVGNCVRNFALKLPTANKVRDFVFTGITIGLIIIYFVK